MNSRASCRTAFFNCDSGFQLAPTALRHRLPHARHCLLKQGALCKTSGHAGNPRIAASFGMRHLARSLLVESRWPQGWQDQTGKFFAVLITDKRHSKTHAGEVNAPFEPQLVLAHMTGQIMKIVVIGGSGFIGSKLVDILRKQGHEVVPASPSFGINTITAKDLVKR
jgi:NAD-dependent epimerase/dehydratase family protein